MEQMLKEILSAVKGLDNKVSAIDKRLNNLETDVAEVKTDISGMKTDISGVKTDILGMKTDISGMKTDIANLEGQMIETNQIVKALMHRSEELDAKFDGLLHTTATKEAINSLEAKIDALNARLFHQEADIQLLKKKAL